MKAMISRGMIVGLSGLLILGTGALVLWIVRRTPDGTAVQEAAGTSAQEDFFIRTAFTGEQVVPGVSTVGSGQVTAILFGNVLSVVGDYQDLSSPIDRLVSGGVHIHQAASGENGKIAFSLNSDGGTQGSFTGIFTLTDEQIQALEQGQYYVQLHTEGNQPGELRAQLAGNIAKADLIGLWERIPEGVVSTAYSQFNPDGTFIDAGSIQGLETSRADAGRYELDGTLIRFISDDRIEAASSFAVGCAGQTGAYQLMLIDSDKLKLILHRDPCQTRAVRIPATFRRLSP